MLINQILHTMKRLVSLWKVFWKLVRDRLIWNERQYWRDVSIESDCEYFKDQLIDKTKKEVKDFIKISNSRCKTTFDITIISSYSISLVLDEHI
jgi:hypothetical protein